MEADEGRTTEQKKELYHEIEEAVCRDFKVETPTVAIIIREINTGNRGKAGKKIAID